MIDEVGIDEGRSDPGERLARVVDIRGIEVDGDRSIAKHVPQGFGPDQLRYGEDARRGEHGRLVVLAVKMPVQGNAGIVLVQIAEEGEAVDLVPELA